MPELPDIEAYLHALQPRLLGHPITAIRLGSPFLLRTTDPPIEAAVGRTVTSLRRVGKRIAIEADGIFVVLHLMVGRTPTRSCTGRGCRPCACRTHWRPKNSARSTPPRNPL